MLPTLASILLAFLANAVVAAPVPYPKGGGGGRGGGGGGRSSGGSSTSRSGGSSGTRTGPIFIGGTGSSGGGEGSGGPSTTTWIIIITVIVVFVIIVGIVVWMIRKSRREARSSMTTISPAGNSSMTMNNSSAATIPAALEVTADGSLNQPIKDASKESYISSLNFVEKNPPMRFTFSPDQINQLFANGPHAFTFIPQCDVSVSDDTVRFPAKTEAVVHTSLPLPLSVLSEQEIFYFEIEILQMDPQTTVAIGLCCKPYPHWRLPGWNAQSIGYHSDDGRLFQNDSHGGIAYAKPYRVNDTVGVGFVKSSRQAFFTRNGQQLKSRSLISYPFDFFPSIGADGLAEVKVNFGQAPFKWTEANERKYGFADLTVPKYTPAPDNMISNNFPLPKPIPPYPSVSSPSYEEIYQSNIGSTSIPPYPTPPSPSFSSNLQQSSTDSTSIPPYPTQPSPSLHDPTSTSAQPIFQPLALPPPLPTYFITPPQTGSSSVEATSQPPATSHLVNPTMQMPIPEVDGSANNVQAESSDS